MILGKLLIDVNVDNVPDNVLQRSQFDLEDEEPPPPIPPKRFKEETEESQYEDVLKYVYKKLYLISNLVRKAYPFF